MSYSGIWKNSPAAVDGENKRSHQTRDNWGTGSDPRHGQRTGHDVPSDVDPNAAIQKFEVEIPPAIEEMWNPGTEPPYFPSPYSEPEGSHAGHDGTNVAPWGIVHNPERDQELNNAARETDRGMARWAVQRHMVGRDWSQHFETERQQSLNPSRNNGGSAGPGQAQRALRGKNSLAENNPGSPEVNFSGNYTRSGYEINRWTPRRMARRSITHTRRMLHLNLAAIAMPSAAPEGDGYSVYTSPFDGRTTNLNVGTARSMMRREPRPWDESTVTDGTETATHQSDYSQYNSWGL